MLAHHNLKRAVGERQCGDVRTLDRDPIIQSDKMIEPPGGVAVLLGQVHRRHCAAISVGDVTRGAPDPATRVQHLGSAGDSGEVHQLAGGDAAHRVEILKRPQICGLQLVEVEPGADQGALDVAPREAGRILGVNVVGRHVLAFRFGRPGDHAILQRVDR